MTKEEKCSSTQANRIVISRGYDEEKRIYIDELPIYESEGWHRGQSEGHKKRNTESKIGRHHRGVTPSDETREKISNTIKTKTASGEIIPGFTGKKHTDKTKEKLSQYRGDKNSQYGKPKSKQWKNKVSKSHKTGKKLSTYLKNRTPEQRHTQLTKAWITKKLNGTVNTSKVENEFYKQLLEENKHKTIYRNYKCDKYPFYCDFYIVEDDLFIELNAHWTHGGKPYDPNDEECIIKLNEWKEKAKTSQYFVNAIETWTVRDVNKLRVATENKLNYKVIY